MFRRVAAGAHADLLTIERAYDEKRKRMRTQIAVEDVRKINGFMALTPAEGGWRVVVVDGAEELNQQLRQRAAERSWRNRRRAPSCCWSAPPPAACCRPSAAAAAGCACRRCADEPMARLLADYLPELGADERGRLVTLAEGSPGRALLLAEEEGLKIAALVDKVLADLPDLPPSRAL